MYWRLEQIRLAEVLAKTLLCVDPADPIVLLWRPASIWQQLKGHFPLDSRQLQMSTVLLQSPANRQEVGVWLLVGV